MKIFKVDPIKSGKKDHRWNASTHKGWAIIRAEDEREAEQVASQAFHKGAGRKIGEEIGNPWASPLVNYTEMTHTEIETYGYSIEGEKGVIGKMISTD